MRRMFVLLSGLQHNLSLIKNTRASAAALPFAARLEQEVGGKCREEVGCDAWWAAASGLLFCTCVFATYV